MEDNIKEKRKSKKIVFMGTPIFAACSLDKLIQSGYNVVGVFTNPDTRAGRGMKTVMSPVKEVANSFKIPVFQPEKLRKNDEVIQVLNDLAPDVIAVVAYGKILPKEILELPKYGSINVHGSLLPKYRGAAPIQWSIINGEKVTGITTMFMDEGMDTGDMLLKEEININNDDNYETLHDKLKEIGADLLVKTLDKVFDGSIKREKQGENYTLAPMIDKKMTKLDFNNTCEDIYNFVRGLYPYPATYFTLDDKIYKVYKVEGIKSDEFNEYNNGDIVMQTKDRLCFKCKDGYISILEIQPQGSKKMDIKSFLAGNKL